MQEAMEAAIVQEAINTYLTLGDDTFDYLTITLAVTIIGVMVIVMLFVGTIGQSSKKIKRVYRTIGTVASVAVPLVAAVFYVQYLEARSQLPTLLTIVQEGLEDTYGIELTEAQTKALLPNLSSAPVSMEVAGQEVRVELARDSSDEWRLYRNGVALPEA